MIESARLILRPWLDSDLDALAAINADPAVHQWLGGPISREMTQASIERQCGYQEAHGHCFWAATLRDGGTLVGMIGIQPVRFEERFTPAVDIGWRLGSEWQGRGLASEGAKAALDHGLNVLRLPNIVSFTAVGNRASRAVMERIGMVHDPDGDFDHPALAADHPLRRHALYRVK
ncbi:GNAT family N-acetyltransferase [Niveispirillum sp. KHB5.9]|uniref:GNAT family N-acetyltransferase n=1 Tax=Niveispirillum sp. KHB5.9 TaxID=3400269 RepID=UPI003A85E191